MQLSDFKEHMDYHPTKLLCDICGEGFNDFGNLDAHLSFHEGVFYM